MVCLDKWVGGITGSEGCHAAGWCAFMEDTRDAAFLDGVGCHGEKGLRVRVVKIYVLMFVDETLRKVRLSHLFYTHPINLSRLQRERVKLLAICHLPHFSGKHVSLGRALAITSVLRVVSHSYHTENRAFKDIDCGDRQRKARRRLSVNINWVSYAIEICRLMHPCSCA
jgi:hypothetical protein